MEFAGVVVAGWQPAAATPGRLATTPSG